MDHNNYPPYNSFFTGISIGRFDYYNNRIQINRRDYISNRICALINIFCGLKLAVIVLSPNPKTLFYLIHLYIIDGFAMKVFDAGVIFIHFSTGKFYTIYFEFD